MNRRNRIWISAIVVEFILLLVLGFVAATVIKANAREEPITTIDSPASNTVYYEGDQVLIQSTSKNPTGITQVQLGVDGFLVHTDSPTQPLASYTVTQTWQAVAGVHTIDVLAFDKANQAGKLATIVIDVLPNTTPTATNVPTATPTSTSTPAPTATPTLVPTSTPTPSLSATCINNLAFVEDVSVPDGSTLAPGQTFNKIWRVQNTGSCTWGNGYTFAYVGGSLLNAPTVVGVPVTPPGATTDLVVPMVAPSTAGTDNGYWELRGPTGAVFGPTLNVTIVVPITPTPIPGICSGVPTISYFTATATTINAGDSITLNWGLVGNADYAEIDNGIGGVATPGSYTVSPATTTTYTLTAFCGPTVQIAQVTITVNPITPTPVCSGVPSISYFNASATTIVAGSSTTLNWGPVGNANYVEIDNGIGGVATPGSFTSSPATTTIYTLTAYCGSNAQIAQVLITVVPPTPVPTPTATLTPTPTAISTPSPTSTSTPIPTSTATPTPTSSATPTPTSTSTPTPTPKSSDTH